MAAWLYIMANRRFGTTYVGSTTNLVQRVWQHRNDVVPSFTKQRQCHLLVHFEEHQDIRRAMQRESNVKHWVQDWKFALIEKENPEWDDLYPLLVHG
jgi:putative endonuclease